MTITECIAEEYPHMMRCYRNRAAALARLADAYNMNEFTVRTHLKRSQKATA